MKPVLTLLALLALTSRAHAAPVDVSGTYDGTWGATTLSQSGDQVTGRYAYDDGAITGTLDGNVLRFTWVEDDGSGHGVFVVQPDGALVGSWGVGDDDRGGGSWVLTRASFAPPSPWQVSLRLPIELGGAAHHFDVGVGGLGIDLGKRVGARWYLGASADAEGLLDIASGEAPERTLLRLRLGAEVRREIHQGTSAVSVNDGPFEPVPRHDWVGARVGVETLDGGRSIGPFADVSIGMDSQLGRRVAFGEYLSAGGSVEPGRAYAPVGALAAAVAPPPRVIAGSFTVGFRLTL